MTIKQHIHLLYKKWDTQNIINYRGALPLPVIYKILSKILLNRREETLDKEFRYYEWGFWKGHFCIKQIPKFYPHYTLPQNAECQIIVVSFVDFKIAFDSWMGREILDSIVREFGVKTKLANVIKEILTVTTFKIMGVLSLPFDIRTGMGQDIGLFNCILEKF